MTLYTESAKNIRKTWFLLAVFFGFVLAVGYALSIYMNNPGIMVFASVAAIGTSVWSYWFSDKMVLKMTGAKEISRENLKEVYNIVENLAITAGLPMPKVYVMDEPGLNAFATGRNPEHAVVVFTRGLLETLTKEEIRGVAAHELSHIGNRDMLISTIAVVLASVVAMASRFLYFGGGSSRERGGGATAIISIALLLLAPLLATLLRLAVSRKREFLADASGAMLTRYPEGLASALEKISGDAHRIHGAGKSTAHLFIANPFSTKGGSASGGKGQKVMKFFMTHPPVEERIARLRNVDK